MKSPSICRSCCYLALSLMLMAGQVHGQVAKDSGSNKQWSTVQALHPGDFVEVRLQKKETFRGTLVSSTEIALTVDAKSGQTTTARSDIKEVKVKRGRGRSQILGAAIGAASGVATAAILDGALTDGNGMSGSAAVFFGAVGAAVGLAITSFRSDYKTVYKAR